MVLGTEDHKGRDGAGKLWFHKHFLYNVGDLSEFVLLCNFV